MGEMWEKMKDKVGTSEKHLFNAADNSYGYGYNKCIVNDTTLHNEMRKNTLYLRTIRNDATHHRPVHDGTTQSR